MKIDNNDFDVDFTLPKVDQFDNNKSVTDVLNNWIRLTNNYKKAQKRRERLEKLNKISNL
jgi:hypothetical protein